MVAVLLFSSAQELRGRETTNQEILFVNKLACFSKLGSGVNSVFYLFGAALLSSVLLFSAERAFAAEERWITDRGEFTMRSGTSTSNKIVRMVKSGTRVELLKTDVDSGYSKIRVNGKEGWVLSRYLLTSAPALVRLPQLEKDLGRVAELSNERQALQGEVRKLESDNKKLRSELDRIKKVSANAMQLDSENSRLKQSLNLSETTVAELETDNKSLSSRASREWFVVGAAVLIIGILLGLIVPRLQVRKKSSW